MASRVRPGSVWLALLGGYVVLIITWLLFDWPPFSAFGLLTEKPILLTAIVVAWQASRRARPSRRAMLAWRLMSLGLLSQLAGVIATDVYLRLGISPYPSLADPLYLSFYPLMLAALLVLPRARLSHSQRVMLGLDLATTALGAAAVGWYFLIAPTARAGGQSTLQMAFSLAYPVGDMILIVGVAWLLMRGVAASMRTVLWLVIVGLCLFVVGDGLYAYATLHGGFENGDALNITYAVGLSLFVLAARWHTSTDAPGEAASAAARRSQRVSWVPYLAVAAGFSVLVLSEAVGESGSLILALVATAIAIVVSARQLFARLALLTMQRLLHEQATTDALTGLGNRRALMSDLQRHFHAGTAETPSLLMLFDLNGFKHYNDTFGHQAGDALLTRLSSALADAVAPFGGRAYRAGGDEFCVIANATAKQPLEEAASRALSETGQGFAVSSAFGTVTIPGNTGDPTEAMRQADNAMYLQKQSGRATAGRQSTDVLLRALAERHPDLDNRRSGLAELVAEVAERLDIAGEELMLLSQAATLHDIGKVAIPDVIVNKSGALDEEEWRFMRGYPLIGERIVSAAASLRRAAPLVRSANESFDGTGYPDGLVGLEIPLGARIIAVCVAFDAMITDPRPNAASMTTAEALAELHRSAGTQFDPVVVAMFQEVMTERAKWPTAAPERQSPQAPRLQASHPVFGRE